MAEILVVDDVEDVRKAIALLKTQRFDLVVTDILMPEGDGTEIMLFLDKMPNRPRVVAMSGGGSLLSPDLALRLARAKADAVLTKPFENSELIATVGRLLG